ncbi:prepilin peptidase [Anaeromicropila herbilytica]|uniref:Prepilin type IV endopeptidase peptidase domain-containing protein n=1 Tax=Anaeromicropila herbilytica TaxID=2785025 RepID=A0A7R7EIT8_9FIRM|nr:A24 family peptidase [Anaeromicropila herbilytica]BCN29529.1 hypothetical protein bsdtb5_08240 [Anaeromicropila herbilytica]
MKEIVLYVCYIVILVYAAYQDSKTFKVSNQVHIVILILSLFSNGNLLIRVLGALVITIPFLYIGIKTNQLGGGDIKFIFANGVFLGFCNNYIGIVIGLILVIILFFIRKCKKLSNKQRMIPLIPYLVVGYFIIYNSQLLLGRS